MAGQLPACLKQQPRWTMFVHTVGKAVDVVQKLALSCLLHMQGVSCHAHTCCCFWVNRLMSCWLFLDLQLSSGHSALHVALSYTTGCMHKQGLSAHPVSTAIRLTSVGVVASAGWSGYCATVNALTIETAVKLYQTVTVLAACHVNTD